jgi:hypothetical protein
MNEERVLVEKEKELENQRKEVDLMMQIRRVDQLLYDLTDAFETLQKNEDYGMSEEEIEVILAELRHIGEGKDSIMGRVRRDLQNLYKRFYERYKDQAIITIDSDICQGCFVRIPPIKFARIRTRKSLEFCESCGRILLWTEEAK